MLAQTPQSYYITSTMVLILFLLLYMTTCVAAQSHNHPTTTWYSTHTDVLYNMNDASNSSHDCAITCHSANWICKHHYQNITDPMQHRVTYTVPSEASTHLQSVGRLLQCRDAATCHHGTDITAVVPAEKQLLYLISCTTGKPRYGTFVVEHHIECDTPSSSMQICQDHYISGAHCQVGGCKVRECAPTQHLQHHGKHQSETTAPMMKLTIHGRSHVRYKTSQGLVMQELSIRRSRLEVTARCRSTGFIA